MCYLYNAIFIWVIFFSFIGSAPSRPCGEKLERKIFTSLKQEQQVR